MTQEKLRQIRIDAEIAKIRQEESEKKLLYDRMIGTGGGKAQALRPSDDFIRQNIGPLRTEQEIRIEAMRRVEAQELQAERQRQREHRIQPVNQNQQKPEKPEHKIFKRLVRQKPEHKHKLKR